MSTEEALQAAIDAAPLDTIPRLVFCDWLDEQGDSRAAGYRVLATFDRWPWLGLSSLYFWYHTSEPNARLDRLQVQRNHGSDRSGLGFAWQEAVDGRGVGARRTVREAMNAAALAWLTLTVGEQAATLTFLREQAGTG